MIGNNNNTIYFDQFESPIGPVLVVARGGSLCSVDFLDYEDRMEKLLVKRFGDFERRRATDPAGFTTRLKAYFAGDFGSIKGVPLDFHGTAFQETVWRALCDIPLGTTETYGQLATRIGKPAASRAVGHANSQNPIAIVVPCHRVIGANASLTGYAGGMHRKQWLLEHERGVRSLFAGKG